MNQTTNTTTGIDLDDDPEFQKAVVELGRAMFEQKLSGDRVLAHWQSLNWIILKWENKKYGRPLK